MPSPVSEFNSIIMWFLKVLKQKNPKSDSVALFCKRISMAKNSVEDCLIVACGPYLIKYRDNIDSPPDVNTDSDMLPAFAEDTDKLKKDSMEWEILHLIGQQYRKSTPEEKHEYHAKLQKMLDKCLEYEVGK